MKIFLYLSFASGSNNDVETQRKGVVILVWFDPSFTLNPISRYEQFDFRMYTKLSNVAVTRTAVIHMCAPDTAIYRFRRSILTTNMEIGQTLTRLRMHIGKYSTAFVLQVVSERHCSGTVIWHGLIYCLFSYVYYYFHSLSRLLFRNTSGTSVHT